MIGKSLRPQAAFSNTFEGDDPAIVEEHVRGEQEGDDDEGAEGVRAEEDHGETLDNQPEEVQARVPVPSPDMPTASQLDDHLVDNLPYRGWCDG